MLRNILSDGNGEESPAKNKVRDMPCPLCSKLFFNCRGMNTHIVKMHPEIGVTERDEITWQAWGKIAKEIYAKELAEEIAKTKECPVAPSENAAAGRAKIFMGHPIFEFQHVFVRTDGDLEELDAYLDQEDKKIRMRSTMDDDEREEAYRQIREMLEEKGSR